MKFPQVWLSSKLVMALFFGTGSVEWKIIYAISIIYTFNLTMMVLAN